MEDLRRRVSELETRRISELEGRRISKIEGKLEMGSR
jgi:hypothetical protein